MFDSSDISEWNGNGGLVAYYAHNLQFIPIKIRYNYAKSILNCYENPNKIGKY